MTKIQKLPVSILLVLFMIIVLGAFLLHAQTSDQVSVGDRIQTTTNTNIHSYGHTTDSKTLGVQPAGSIGTVLGGPFQQDRYYLWFVDYDTGADGWTVEDNMQKIFVSPSNPDIIPPSKPTQLVAAGVSLTQIDLSWYSSRDDNGVAGYEIFRNGVKIKTVIGTDYSDTGLVSGVTYNYGVRSIDKSGNTSGTSEISITAPKKQSDFRIIVKTNNSALINNTALFIDKKADYACVLPLGIIGTIIDGPRTSYHYTIWNVSFAVGCSGWVVQDSISSSHW